MLQGQSKPNLKGLFGRAPMDGFRLIDTNELVETSVVVAKR